MLPPKVIHRYEYALCSSAYPIDLGLLTESSKITCINQFDLMAAPLVVPALRKHTATVIWAHGLGDRYLRRVVSE